MYLEVCCRLLLYLVGQWVYLESVQTRDELVGWSLGPVLRVNHEQHVRETSAEICPIRVVVPIIDIRM